MQLLGKKYFFMNIIVVIHNKTENYNGIHYK